MELSQIKDLIDNYAELKRLIILSKENGQFYGQYTVFNQQGQDGSFRYSYQNEYNALRHDITDRGKRPDKLVYFDDPESTAETPRQLSRVETVSRLVIPLQRMIVSRAAAFLCGKPIQLNAEPANPKEQDMYDLVKKTWDDNKLDFESKRLAKIMMSETEVAELWYNEEVGPEFWANTPNSSSTYTIDGKTSSGPAKLKLRMKVLANKYGDLLYPVFNNAADMVAFGRQYSIHLGDATKQQHFDIYTDDEIYYGENNNGIWNVTSEINIIGKIPVIYYSQELPEWAEVQFMIDRLEKLVSNHADTNDYNGSPMLKVTGDVKGFSKKGEAGKIIELENGGDAQYLDWKGAPESIKMEYLNLRSLIFDMTDTPDISFEQMSKIGKVTSGIALKMLFLSAHMKAADKEENFGKSVQRRINYIKYAMSKINLQQAPGLSIKISPKFEFFLPNNDTETIQDIATARSAGIISQETAVTRNPLIEDSEGEYQKLKDEANNELVNQSNIL